MSGVRIPVRSPLILGISQVGKAHDFDSCMRRFESCIPSHIKCDSLAQSVEHLTFNQGVRSSNLRWVTNMKRRHDQVAKVEDCNSFIPSSNLGVASKKIECRSGGTGRRTGLKILRDLPLVPVRFRSSAPFFTLNIAGCSSWQLVGLITRRSQVRVLPPQPLKI